MIVRPLTQDIWLSLRQELQDAVEVRLADSLYCDALLSIVAGDRLKALVEAGVAAEVAVTQLLLAVSHSAPDSPAKREFRDKHGGYHRFEEKLCDWPRRLGLDAAETFKIQGMPTGWVSTARELYKLRNGVAHQGSPKVSAGAGGIRSSIFAINTLIEYCRTQRAKVGLEEYTMPTGVTPFSQTLALHDACIAAESSPCGAAIP